MRKKRPTYSLRSIQRLVEQGHGFRIVTLTALDNAGRLGIDESDIVEAVLSLRPHDFYKSMEAEKAPGLWQDVYHGRHGQLALYVKLQLTADGRAVVIQFKER